MGDEFHIQALVQVLSLKSPKWNSWLHTKLKFLKNKYLQKQSDMADKRRNTSSNSLRHANAMIDFNIAIDHFDEGYLLNLLKFYQYLTFVEPNMDANAVSVMANSFLFDADQRNLLVGFFSQLKEFWPAESSKSVSAQKPLNDGGNSCPSSQQQLSQSQHYKSKSAADRIDELQKINKASGSGKKTMSQKKKSKKRKYKNKRKDRGDDGVYDVDKDIADQESSELSESFDGELVAVTKSM